MRYQVVILVAVLPGGLAVALPDGKDVTELLAEHKVATLSEGICPDHGTPLVHVPSMPLVGRCDSCDGWWHVCHRADGEGQAGWTRFGDESRHNTCANCRRPLFWGEAGEPGSLLQNGLSRKAVRAA